MRFIILAWATGLGAGYFPKMPGSIGTLVGVVLFYFLQYLPLTTYIITLLVFTLFAVWVSTQAESILGKKDDSRIVIDEVVGFLFAVTGFYFTWPLVILAYVLFRFFDIAKPFPINWIQKKFPAGWGVVLDDVMAGIYTWICLLIVKHALLNIWEYSP